MTSIHQVILIAITFIAAASAQYAQPLPMELGLSPRFYLGLPPQLQHRSSGVCAADSHLCLDVNATSTACCLNTQYCFIDPNFETKCCAIGSNCDSACPASQYQCNATTTISGTAATTTSCCERTCPQTSAFKCASEFGGGCCAFGSNCQSGKQCSATATTASALVSVVPSGCTTNQFACATSLGGGCCDNGMACTVVSNTNYCASASSSTIRTGPNGSLASGTPASLSSSGLSTGAKAGIGAGLAVGGSIVIGLVLWFCISHRRHAQKKQSSSASAPSMSQQSGTATSKRPLVEHHQVSDYFGPQATSGPYTDKDAGTSMAGSPGMERGVPLSPSSPDDITAPVEIDSRDYSNATSPGWSWLRGPKVSPTELP